MARQFKMTYPRMRLEAQLTGGAAFSPGFALMRYTHDQANMRWWQRTITATDDQWLRLSGRHGADPADTWHQLLNHPDRPVLPLPLLVLTDFAAYAGTQAQPETWWLLHWVAWAIDDLLRFSPLPPSTSGGLTIVPDTLDATINMLVDAVLDGHGSLPWPTADGIQLQVLIRLGELIWSFPPNLVRRLIQSFVSRNDQDNGLSDVEHADESQAEDDHRPVVGPGQLVQVSGMHWWRAGAPTIRHLPVHMSRLAFPALAQQALVVMHPDAPMIDDRDLARLCDGSIGYESDSPSPVHTMENDTADLSDFSPAVARRRIARYVQEAAINTTIPTGGQWDIPASSHFPLFRACALRAIRVMALPTGCWVRFLPRDDGWGKVLWWGPQVEPAACLAFALGTGSQG